MHPSPTVVAYVLDPLERAGRTFAQQFVVVLMVAGGPGALATQHWALAADSAALAALVSLVTSVATFRVPVQPPAIDIALRVLKTLLQSFLGTVAAAHLVGLSHLDWHGALALAVPVAGAALLTSLAALGISKTASASLLPPSLLVAPRATPAQTPVRVPPPITPG